jgi:hypothetical protein
MTSDHASSIQAVALRVAKLDPSGAPLVGASNCYATSQFSTATFTPEYDEGDEIQEKGADGSICVYYKVPDVLKRVNISLSICNPQPEITEILAGGTLLTAVTTKTITNKAIASNVGTLTANAHGYSVGDLVTVSGVDSTFNGTWTLTAVTANTFSFAVTHADVTSSAATGTVAGPDHTAAASGWAAPLTGTQPNPNGVGLEIWSRAIVGGKPASVNPYWRWVFPFGQFRMDGDRVLENGAMANVFTGHVLGNPAFGAGPGDDWTLGSASAVQYGRDATAPVGVNAYQPVA